MVQARLWDAFSTTHVSKANVVAWEELNRLKQKRTCTEWDLKTHARSIPLGKHEKAVQLCKETRTVFSKQNPHKFPTRRKLMHKNRRKTVFRAIFMYLEVHQYLSVKHKISHTENHFKTK